MLAVNVNDRGGVCSDFSRKVEIRKLQIKYSQRDADHDGDVSTINEWDKVENDARRKRNLIKKLSQRMNLSSGRRQKKRVLDYKKRVHRGIRGEIN